MKQDFAPLKKKSSCSSPWEGSCQTKPWAYRVTAAIPCLDTYEQLALCVRILRLQTERPYIVVIDTGSSEDEYKKVESLRADDLEVHCLRFNGMLHPSDFPAVAMDLAFSSCRTEYLYATHSDVFLRRRNFLEHLLTLCPCKSPVVGYELSPRQHADWKGMVSHTASMYHMPTMDKIGFGWSLRRLSNLYNIKDYRPNPLRPTWPDTEILGNYVLRMYAIKPHLIGSEPNFERKKDENIDHFRSFTSGKLYSPSYHERAKKWYESARKEAEERIGEWGEKNDNRRSI